MEGLGRYAAPLFMGASLLYALGQKHRRDVTKERQEGAHNRILVTGGAGYIGSHTVLLLLEAGYEVVVVDNMVNSCEESLRRVGELTGKAEKITFCKTDLLDKGGLEHVFLTYGRFRACIHFAGLKAVGESVAKPLLYYENNLTGTLNLLDAMQRHGCKIIVFSSSATVYGSAESPVVEEQTVGQGITNPYGQTKYFIEKFLEDFQRSPEGKSWKVVILRYFNPVGSHESGRIGEDPSGTPNNLMPYVSQVAVGRRPQLTVFGGNYKTKDGTGVRDYIHVMDLAEGHLSALDYAKARGHHGGCFVFNLGTGKGYSVLEMIAAMEKASGRKINFVVGDRRPGDLDEVYSDPSKAERELGWKATRNLDDMTRDLWRWQQQNPHGYK